MDKTIQPIFKSIFGDIWDRLPTVMRQHYANRPYSRDRISVTGYMNIKLSIPIKLIAPALKYLGILVPYIGKNVFTVVSFESSPTANTYTLLREFYFPNRKPFIFRSTMEPQHNGDIIEYMRCGIGWRAHYKYDGSKVLLLHRGYIWRFGKHIFQIPIEWLIGKGYAEEQAIDDVSFHMMMEIKHPFWGYIYGYDGTFQISKVAFDE